MEPSPVVENPTPVPAVPANAVILDTLNKPNSELARTHTPRPRIVYPPASHQSARIAAKNSTSPAETNDDTSIPILEDTDEDDSAHTMLNADFPLELQN